MSNAWSTSVKHCSATLRNYFFFHCRIGLISMSKHGTIWGRFPTAKFLLYQEQHPSGSSLLVYLNWSRLYKVLRSGVISTARWEREFTIRYGQKRYLYFLLTTSTQKKKWHYWILCRYGKYSKGTHVLLPAHVAFVMSLLIPCIATKRCRQSTIRWAIRQQSLSVHGSVWKNILLRHAWDVLCLKFQCISHSTLRALSTKYHFQSKYWNRIGTSAVRARCGWVEGNSESTYIDYRLYIYTSAPKCIWMLFVA